MTNYLYNFSKQKLIYAFYVPNSLKYKYWILTNS